MAGGEYKELEEIRWKFINFIKGIRWQVAEWLGTLRRFGAHNFFFATFGSPSGLRVLDQIIDLCLSLEKLVYNEAFRATLDADRASPVSALLPFVGGGIATADIEIMFRYPEWIEKVMSESVRRVGETKIKKFFSSAPKIEGMDKIVEGVATRLGLSDLLSVLKEITARTRLPYTAEEEFGYMCVANLTGRFVSKYSAYLTDSDRKVIANATHKLRPALIYELYNKGIDLGKLDGKLANIRVVLITDVRPERFTSSSYLFIFHDGKIKFVPTIMAVIVKEIGALLGDYDTEGIRKFKQALHKLNLAFKGLLDAINDRKGVRAAAKEYADAWDEFLSLWDEYNMPNELEGDYQFGLVSQVRQIFRNIGKEGVIRAIENHLLFRKQRPHAEPGGGSDIVMALQRIGNMAKRLRAHLSCLVPFMPSDRQVKYITDMTLTAIDDGQYLFADWEKFGRQQWLTGDEDADEERRNRIKTLIEEGRATKKAVEELADFIARKGNARAFMRTVQFYGIYRGRGANDSYIAIEPSSLATLERHRQERLTELLTQVEGLMAGLAESEWMPKLQQIIDTSEIKSIRTVKVDGRSVAIVPFAELIKVAKLTMAHPEFVTRKILEPIREATELGRAEIEKITNTISAIFLELEGILMRFHGGGAVIEALASDPDPVRMFTNINSLLRTWVTKGSEEGRRLRKALFNAILRIIVSRQKQAA